MKRLTTAFLSTGAISTWRRPAALGKKDEARTAYQAAIAAAKKLDPERQAEYTKYIEASLKKL
jgi:hypothetical protein